MIDEAVRNARAVGEGVPCTTLAQQQELANGLLVLFSSLVRVHTWLSRGIANGDEGRMTDGRLRAMAEDALDEARIALELPYPEASKDR